MKNDILDFIVEELLDDETMVVENNTSLFKEKILDSMNLLQLVSFIEETYEVKIGAMDMVFENLDTIDSIQAFILRTKNA